MKHPKYILFATFDNFTKARDVVMELKVLDLREKIIDDIDLFSPIEHPDVEEMLGEIHQPIQRFTFFGAVTGALCSFLLVAAAAQSMFTVQPQGGKAVIPLPTDIVIAYEGTILFGVLCTLGAFLAYAGLPRRLSKHYNEKVSDDQIGIEVTTAKENIGAIKDVLNKFEPLEIREITQ
ncbi:MAG: DUF3341 domain-containing protein [Mariprofundales bacterium]|nr:DUF3341 domain-containing protein [Mariprofundales bacterium]